MSRLRLLASLDLQSTAGHQYQRQVMAGADYLDGTYQAAWWAGTRGPGANPIRLKQLDMGDERLCILGQLYGTYWDAPLVLAVLDRFGMTPDSEVDPGSDMAGVVRATLLVDTSLRGFELPANEHHLYPLLTTVWRKLIQARRSHFRQ